MEMRAPSGGDGGLSWPRLTASRGLWERSFTAQSIRIRDCLRLRAKGVDFGRDEAAIGCCPAPERASRTGLHVPFLLGVPRNDWDVES